MVHRTIAVITLFAYCIGIAGCTSTVHETIIRDEMPARTNDKIVEVTLDNGTVIRFDDVGGHINQKLSGQTFRTMIVGYTWDKKRVEVDLENVLGAKTETTETDGALTALLIFLGIPVATIAVILLIFIISPPRF